MTRDDIIAMARETGLEHRENADEFNSAYCDGIYLDDLERFAVLVAAAEREACARVCDEMRHPSGYSAETEDWVGATDNCAAAIRARGQE